MGFLFTVCHVGAEPALKAELQREHPELRFAYSRPGFLTFKSEDELDPGFELRSVFARAWGVSLGKATAKDGDTAARVAAAVKFARMVKPVEGRLVLHAFEREQHAHGEEPKGYEYGAWSGPMEAAIRAAAGPGFFADDTSARKKEFVFDAVAVAEDEWWFGVHRQQGSRSPDPGARPALTLPAESPSRAWLKLEEGIRWSGAPLRAGDTAVELGSSPGGACYSLLQRGLQVVGIDPAPMSEAVTDFPGGKFRHLAEGAMMVRRNHLPESVEWMLLDMNVAPGISLTALRHVAQPVFDTLLGALLTIKLGSWEMAAEVPAMLEKLKVFGFKKVRATQLARSGQEIFVYALTEKGMKRS